MKQNKMNANVLHHTDERPHPTPLIGEVILFTVIGSQCLIWWWQKRHPRSFFLFTLFGLWLFPIIMSVKMRYFRFITVWCIFSIVFGLLLRMSRQYPMNRKTPRYLYSWFFVLYKITSILTFLGYILFLADFFGFGLLIFGPHPNEEREYRNKLIHHQHEQHMHMRKGDENDPIVKEEMMKESAELKELSHNYHHIHFADIGIYMLFYGLYFGVLARDSAQLCADWISSALGFFNPTGFPRRRVPTNICAVCNNLLSDHGIGLLDGNQSENDEILSGDSSTNRRMKLMKQRRRMNEKEEAVKKKRGFPFNVCTFSGEKQDEEIELDCGHWFHGFCIRGWIMIGKRDVCPVCKEKVNLRGIFANPWQKQDRMWSQLLDGVRYLMVWNPVIVLAANVVFKTLGISLTGNKQTTQQPN